MSLFLSHCLPRAKPRTRCFIITLFMSPTRQLRCRHRWNTEVNRSPSYCCHSAALSVRNHPNSIGFVVAGAWTLRRLEILIQAVNKRPRPPPERRRLFWLGDGFAYLCRRRIAEMEQQLAEGSAYLKKLKVICFVPLCFILCGGRVVTCPAGMRRGAHTRWLPRRLCGPSCCRVNFAFRAPHVSRFIPIWPASPHSPCDVVITGLTKS